MLEKIPDYKQDHKSLQATAGVDLTPVKIAPSLLLHRLEIFVYSFMLLAASLAIFPFLLTSFYWPLVWLIFLLMIVAAIRRSVRIKKSPSVSFSVAQKVWHLQTAEDDIIVKPCGDILVWSGLIILPLQETASGCKHRVLALPDSMSADDWRRLRVWLRMALYKNL